MDEITVGTAIAQSGRVESASANALGSLGGDAFLKLLVAQLRYQNPLEPTGANELMQQTASFSQVETLQALASTQQQLAGLSQFSLAVGLAGKEVAAVGATGQAVVGPVDGVRFGEWIPLSNVVEVVPES